MAKNELADLKEEIEEYLNFWMEHMLTPDGQVIYPEIDNSMLVNKTAELGSMYLSRIVYGAVRGGLCMNSEKYSSLAATALKMLEELRNPSGGYYWARKYTMEWIHDPENVNMAQAFALYGLAEYAKGNNSKESRRLVKEQLKFIRSTLRDNEETYLDGFDSHWRRGNNMTRSFATHFHLMEAYVKVYELFRNDEIAESIQHLLTILLDRFIDKEDYSCIHRFSEDWQPLPNENWAGHNAECSWVICHAAKSIQDEDLIIETQKMAVLMMDKLIDTATDRVYGGYYNLISSSGAVEEERSWWPQAEITLGLWNVYEITGDHKYHHLAKEQISYIRKHFLSKNGEWYGAINSKGEPVQGTPQVFFWKSMYHTVRYYDYLLSKV